MKVKVLFFASCTDIVGSRELAVEITDGSRVQNLVDELVTQFPRLVAMSDVLSVAVNAEYTGTETELREGDEVALIPPVSGG